MDYAKILIVDDEPVNVRLLERILGRAGYTRLRSTTNPREVIALIQEFDPDIVLLDLQMPETDGFTILAELKALLPAGTYLPVLVLTADATSRAKLRALSEGAHDFLTKPFDKAEVILRVGNLLQTRRLQLQLEGQKDNLEGVIYDRTQELAQAQEELRQIRASEN